VEVLGVDIGGSGIKAAPVDVTAGALTRERVKVATPQPAKPKAIADAVRGLVEQFGWSGKAGITFPGVVTDGVIRTAANLDPAWIGVNARDLFGSATGLEVQVINDADAAGLAEMRFGAGAGQQGTVIMLTFGTGIGSALFIDGTLVPNTELGHIEIRGKDAEKRASDRAREVHDLDWAQWAGRVDEYMSHLEALLWPGLLIVGGGVSRKADKFLPRLEGLRARVVPAKMLNDAGIVGAALVGA
jgi:polyphosphate glucokinase